MIILFYLLFVWLSPADFSWLWLFIALVMQFLTEWAYQREYAHKSGNKNYWKGDE